MWQHFLLLPPSPGFLPFMCQWLHFALCCDQEWKEASKLIVNCCAEVTFLHTLVRVYHPVAKFQPAWSLTLMGRWYKCQERWTEERCRIPLGHELVSIACDNPDPGSTVVIFQKIYIYRGVAWRVGIGCLWGCKMTHWRSEKLAVCD